VPTATSSEQARLFGRAQRIAQLRHPNLVRMLPMPGGAGLAPTLTQGRRLSDFTPAGTFKRFQLVQVVQLLLDVLSGLSALHEDVEDGVGFVHGDVCPRNIFVADDGTARLVPVLSRHWLPEAPTLANGYAAPEFLLSARVDPRADLFSVGVMLGEALTGRTLFPDPALDAVLVRLLGGKLLPLRPSPENLWALPLCAIAERAIAPYPELRFETAVELSNAIGAAVAPHFARQPQDGWQAEAPTLVRVPRPSGAFTRTLTPLATVLDLEPASDSPLELAASGVETLERTQQSRRAKPGNRGWVWALGAVAASAALVLALATRSAPKPQPSQKAAAQGELVQSSTAVAIAAPPNSAPGPSTSPTPRAASPSVSVAPGVSPSARSSADPASKPRRRAKPAPGHEDYGF
jgi:serine/threonine-protein kinase